MSASENVVIEDIVDIMNILWELNGDNLVDWPKNLNDLYEKNLNSCSLSNKLKTSEEEISNLVPELKKYNPDDTSNQWKYLCLNFHHLLLLRIKLDTTSENLSVQQTNQLKNVVRNVVAIGIASNLLQNLPYHLKLQNSSIGSLIRYKQLIATTFGISLCFQCDKLRPVIYPNLKIILSAFYQILHCPLKKPTGAADKDGFIMTQEIYAAAIEERHDFDGFFKEFSSKIHKSLYIRETMMLTGLSHNKSLEAPNWLKRAVYSTLGGIIRGPKGLENVMASLLDVAEFDTNDSTKSWMVLDVIARMLVNYRKLSDFTDNICVQLTDLLKLNTTSLKAMETLFSLSTRLLFQQDAGLCKRTLVGSLLKPLKRLSGTQEGDLRNGEILTYSISQTMRVLRLLFLECKFNIPALPVDILTAVMNIIFRIYSVTYDATDNTEEFNEINHNIRDIIDKYMQENQSKDAFVVFDTILFGISNASVLDLRKDIELVAENKELLVKFNTYSTDLRPLRRAETLRHLLKNNLNLSTILFKYLLNCLIERGKYFASSVTNQDLLQLEANECVLNEALERKLAVHQLLIELTEKQDVQKHMSSNPSEVLNYINKYLEDALDKNVHKLADFESEEFQILFVMVTLLEELRRRLNEDVLNEHVLKELLTRLSRDCVNPELRELINRILTTPFREAKERFGKINEAVEETPLNKAIADVCDPIIAVRGHGLMSLAKLIEQQDGGALERKQYILNIFQVNLKSEDSYIYLNAISGLAVMADIFTETVLNVLTQEYSDCSRKNSEDGHEVRMKVGEVLVRVTKGLGEMAPKYKSLLLNAFLLGAKDEDDFIRASSLSNLGELCRILGYKLGTVVTEVLVCVHSIITTDKAVGARRAAITVIRQLFVGLEKETILFLKDDILPIYRTLKVIYNQDADDVMRLQAQLALEQLNENMKDFIFPQFKLHTEKKCFLFTSNKEH